jgi:hypothetical protein
MDRLGTFLNNQTDQYAEIAAALNIYGRQQKLIALSSHAVISVDESDSALT